MESKYKKYCEVTEYHKTADTLLEAIKKGENKISQSILYVVALILEHCLYANGTPQNTLVMV